MAIAETERVFRQQRGSTPKPPQDDPPALGIDGADLTSIEIYFQVRLKFGGISVTIGTPFHLVSGEKTYDLDPERRGDLEQLHAAYPASVVSAGISSNLTLRIELSSGAVIEVQEHPMYESWQVAGPGGRLIICPPTGGSGLAIWD